MRQPTQIYQSNYRQSRPTHNRESDEYQRRAIRCLRRYSPTHDDVRWYAASLGLEPYRIEVTRREAYSWHEQRWYEVPRLCRPSAHACLRIAIAGPTGKLP